MTLEYQEITEDMNRKKELKERYDAACNAYLDELLSQWELDACYGYWNSDAPGTIYHYGETHNLSMEEIIYCVEKRIGEDEVLEWEDYCLEAMEFGFARPSLDAWHTGYPRTPQDVFDRLRGMTQQLNDLIDEEKERIKKEQEKAE